MNTLPINDIDFGKPLFSITPWLEAVIRSGTCPLCLLAVNLSDASDIEVKEYTLSGVCLTCQRALFE